MDSEQVLPVKVYAGVFVALLVLTAITVGVSLLELGALAIYVAMVVAVVKTSLVIGYFMHLKFDVRFNTFVFLSAVLFLVIFFALTMLDLGTRGDVLEEQGNFRLRDEKAYRQRQMTKPPTNETITVPKGQSDADRERNR